MNKNSTNFIHLEKYDQCDVLTSLNHTPSELSYFPGRPVINLYTYMNIGSNVWFCHYHDEYGIYMYVFIHNIMLQEYHKRKTKTSPLNISYIFCVWYNSPLYMFNPKKPYSIDQPFIGSTLAASDETLLNTMYVQKYLPQNLFKCFFAWSSLFRIFTGVFRNFMYWGYSMM